MPGRFFVALLALVLVGGAFGSADAVSSYVNTFSSTYASSISDDIFSCYLCHTIVPSRNAYGSAWANAGHNFTTIESVDSDGDGARNVTEINAGTNPGDPASKPAPPVPGGPKLISPASRGLYWDDVNRVMIIGGLSSQDVPRYSLVLSSSLSGVTLTKSPDKALYDVGETVAITASAQVTVGAITYAFDSWTGDLTGSANPASITMNANKSITANYQPQGGVDAPACSTGGGLSAAGPKCIAPNAGTFTYIENLSPGQMKYYMVSPPAGTTVMTVEYVSRDQLADCNIVVQEGSINNIAANYNTVISYADANNFYSKLYKQTLGGVPVYAFLSRQTAENVPITPVQQVNYYFVVKNVSTDRTATIILYSTTR